jgi:integral membrane protein (TIGR01906 family)
VGKLRIFGTIARWIFIVCLPVLFFTASIAWGFNSTWLFDYGFHKYNVSLTTGIPDSELDKIGGGWIHYINSSEQYWHITITADGKSFELFTPDEQIHFKDVKQLIWLDYRAGLAALVIVLAYALTFIFWRRGQLWRYLAQSVMWGSGLAILLIIIFGVASILDFDQLFLRFHYLVFTNPYWSANGYMLLLFPGGFWQDAALIVIAIMAGLAIISGVVALLYRRGTRETARNPFVN